MEPTNKKITAFFKEMKKKDKIVVGVCLAALILLLVSSGYSKAANVKPNTQKISSQNYKTALETQLRETLRNVRGVGQVNVMITLEGEITETPVFNENTSGSSTNDMSDKTSTQTSTSKDAVMVKDSAGSFPYTVSDKYPQIVGVVIVAQGAENTAVKSYIINAVKTSLGVSAHKIVVLPKE